MTYDKCAAGGYMPGEETWAVLKADECVLRPPFDGKAVCIRSGHPTQTSDCTVENWIRHESMPGGDKE